MHRTLFAIALLACWTPSASAQDMIGVSWAGDVYQIDSTTGSGSLIGNAGNYSFNSLARRSDGKLFTADAAGSSNDIYEIDPVNATATLVQNVPLPAVRALAFDAGDVLYAIVDSGSSAPSDILYTVDLATGGVTQIGDTGFDNVQALAWGQGTLYAWDVFNSAAGSGFGLITIDPQTGVGTDVDPSTSPADAGIQSLTFDGQGRLIGGRDQLFEVDVSSGKLTLIGGSGISDVRGLEFTGGGSSGPTIYCTAKPTSIAGCVPTIGGPSGSASLSGGSGSYDVTCGPVPGQLAIGVVVYTTSGALASPVQSSFGTMCIDNTSNYFVVQPPQTSGGTLGSCSGLFTFDFGAYLAGPNGDPALVSGAQVDMQAFYRDPLNNGGANLSNAMAFTLVP